MTMMTLANDNAGCGAEDAGRTVPLTPPREIRLSIMRVTPSTARSMVVEESSGNAVLLVALAGSGVASVGDADADIDRRQALIVGRRKVALRWADDAVALVISFPRALAQICASARHGDARRLAHGPLPIDLDMAADLLRCLSSLKDRDVDGEEGATIVQSLLLAMAAQHGADAAFPRSRAVSFARTCLDGCIGEAESLDILAGKAGVTPITLQRGFKACLGMTVASYAQAVRLHGARERLMCGRESRSIAGIAHGAGFQSVTSFTRSYQKLFGETPTQTRMVTFGYNKMKYKNSG